MAIIRLEALKQLSAAISCEIPELDGNICEGQADASHKLAFPHLVLKPIRWTYVPHQAEEVYDSAPDRVVMNVGAWEGEVQLILGHKHAYGRYELEQELLDLFLSTPMQPGILNTPVLACREKLGPFTASWELDADAWQNEAAFDQQFYSTLFITGILPALVTRKDAYTIEQLQLGLTEDFDVSVNAQTLNTLSQIDVVQVNSDGTIQPVP